MMEFDLKEVFSILDENDEGQVQLRRFVDVANNYYSDAEVSDCFVFNLNNCSKRRKREKKKKKEIQILIIRFDCKKSLS